MARSAPTASSTVAFPVPPSLAEQAAGGPAPESYELALQELDSLVQQMEGGQLPLDRLLAAHRRGADLLNFCRARLQAVEEQVKVLEDGQLKPWGGGA